MSNNVESEIFNANLSVESECLELYKKVNASLGPISILINNASTFRKNNLENTTINELREDYFVNVLAPFILAQNIFKNKNLSKGKIINISDWKTARTNRFSYGVSKSGIFGLTKSLAVSMAPNFQVNEIAFGAMLPPADEPDRIPQKINLGPIQWMYRNVTKKWFYYRWKNLLRWRKAYLLIMKNYDKIFIEGLKFYSVIGINNWEKNTKQPVIIDLSLFIEKIKKNNRDKIEETVDYKNISYSIKELVEKNNFELIETMGKEIAFLCLRNEKVLEVEVKINKPEALKISNNVGILIKRSKNED